MEIPRAFTEALRRREDIILKTPEDAEPHLTNAGETATWTLRGFSEKAALLFADNYLEQQGYRPAARNIAPSTFESDVAMRWIASDP